LAERQVGGRGQSWGAECSAVDFAKKNLASDADFELARGTYNVKFLTSENLAATIGTFEAEIPHRCRRRPSERRCSP
jgi:hypothetical protein